MKLITTAEVAERFEVSSSTVINWLKKGYLPCLQVKRGRKKSFLFSKDAVDRLCEELNQIEEAKERIEEARQEYDNLLEQYHADQKALRQVTGFGSILVSTSYLLPKILELCTPIKELAYNQAKAIRMYAEGSSLEEIGGELHVSRERARQLAYKASRVLACRMNIYDEQKETIKEKNLEIAVMKQEIKRLQDANAKLVLGIRAAGNDVQQEAADGKVNYSRVELLQTRIWDIPEFSVRTLNCLKFAEVETLEELVQYDKKTFLRFRNFGKKSLSELEEVMDGYGLHFGMDVYQYTHGFPTSEEKGGQNETD